MDNNINPSSMMNGMPPVPKNEKKIGPIVGILVIVLVIIIGALYFFSQKLNTTPNVSSETVTKEKSLNSENTANISSGTDVKSLNDDLDAQLKNVDYSF